MTQSGTKFDLRFLVLESTDRATIGIAMMQLGAKFYLRFLVLESSEGAIGPEEAMGLSLKKKKKILNI